MKRIIEKIIGLIVLVFGTYSLYSGVSNIFSSSPPMNFLVQISKLTIAWVAIYGGYQSLKSKELGRRMLIAWFSYNGSIMALIISKFLYNLAKLPERNFNSSFPNQYLAIAFLILCVSGLIYLLTAKIDRELPLSEYRHVQIIGKLLSVLLPGMGRMLAGNKLVGLALIAVYLLLVTSSISSSNSDNTILVIDSVYKLIVWIMFVELDWYVVQNYGKVAQDGIALTPKNSTSETNEV
jgi:drug/metabolite transporter (DMT)-like permease